ncbi:MAG: hypothetical protein IKL18_03570 [Oscillospiraceae bacterium]|nr:hypothetical protein [Oscillospiraceae bacterium]
MKSEKLFDCITEIKEEFIEEGENEKFPKQKISIRKIAGMAAAFFIGVVALGTIGILFAPKASAGGGINREPGENYMSYAGPAFPLAATEDTAGLEFERSINFDFSPYYTYNESYENGNGETVYYDAWKNDAMISDNYTVYNTTGEDITFTAVYPFAGNISTALSRIPQITVDGKEVETELKIGPYSGGFASAWGEKSEVERLNLSSLESWYEYKALLESGDYLKDAFGENPKMEQSVKVYSFEIEYNIPMTEFDEIENPDMMVTFDYDTEKSNVYFYGFNSLRWNEDEGWVKAGSYIPKSFSPDFENHPIYIIVTGEDIENIGVKTVSGESKGSWDEREETEVFGITSEKYESTLGEAIYEIISSGDYESHYFDEEPTVRNLISNEEYLGYVAEFMYAHGQLSEDPAERYDRGRLDDIIIETGHVSRVMYLTFEVTVPAGGTLEIGTKTLREASYDFVGKRHEKDLEGFDLVTRLGTNLNITKQKASVSNAEEIEIVYNNFGFDLPNGISSVVLGEEEHYWMEICKIRAEKG